MMVGVPKPNHNRRVPKRSNRNNFTKSVRQAVYDRDNGICQMCMGKGTEIHHVFFKSRGGRGVATNGLTLCQSCHRKVHNSGELTDYWINVYTDRYGTDFYLDQHDIENRKRDKTKPLAPRNRS